MPVSPLSTLLGFKAIGLVSGLRESDRRVASAILDHFNRKTGQCDPSLETLSVLLGISRRTVIRAISRLESSGLFRKIRHGGNFHRNFYEPGWSRFEQINAEWGARRKAHRARVHTQTLSPFPCGPCHDAGDRVATETCESNLSYVTSANGNGSRLAATDRVRNGLGSESERRASRQAYRPFAVKQISSRDARRDSAQRRWDSDLARQFSHRPDDYARIIEAIDAATSTAATDAELLKRGGGYDHIIQHVADRGICSLRVDEGTS